MENAVLTSERRERQAKDATTRENEQEKTLLRGRISVVGTKETDVGKGEKLLEMKKDIETFFGSENERQYYSMEE